MPFVLEWFGFAEAAAADQRGGLTLVGFNPPMWQVQQLPAVVTLTMVAVLEADLIEHPELRSSPGLTVTVGTSITDPDGVVIAAGQASQSVEVQMEAAEPTMAKLNLVIASQLQIQVEGNYTATLRVTVDGQPELSRSRRLRIGVVAAAGSATATT